MSLYSLGSSLPGTPPAIFRTGSTPPVTGLSVAATPIGTTTSAVSAYSGFSTYSQGSTSTNAAEGNGSRIQPPIAAYTLQAVSSATSSPYLPASEPLNPSVPCQSPEYYNESSPILGSEEGPTALLDSVQSRGLSQGNSPTNASSAQVVPQGMALQGRPLVQPQGGIIPPTVTTAVSSSPPAFLRLTSLPMPAVGPEDYYDSPMDDKPSFQSFR